jgi:hypothetical protein
MGRGWCVFVAGAALCKQSVLLCLFGAEGDLCERGRLVELTRCASGKTEYEHEDEYEHDWGARRIRDERK